VRPFLKKKKKPTISASTVYTDIAVTLETMSECFRFSLKEAVKYSALSGPLPLEHFREGRGNGAVGCK
jgi:hypothetical protein